MKLCIPTESNLGMDALVFDHFGSAPFFIIVETGTGEIEVISNQNQHHSHGQCMPMQQLGSYQIEGVVCRGMGRNALARLSSAGINVFIAVSNTVSEVVEKARAGQLKLLDADQACGGHGHNC